LVGSRQQTPERLSGFEWKSRFQEGEPAVARRFPIE